MDFFLVTITERYYYDDGTEEGDFACSIQGYIAFASSEEEVRRNVSSILSRQKEKIDGENIKFEIKKLKQVGQGFVYIDKTWPVCISTY